MPMTLVDQKLYAGSPLLKAYKTRFHLNPVLSESEVQAIKNGYPFREFTDEQGWHIRGKLSIFIALEANNCPCL